MAKLVSAWTDKGKNYLVERVSNDEIKIRTVPAKYSFFVKGFDDQDRADIARDQSVVGVSQDKFGYTRVDCKGRYDRVKIVDILNSAIKANQWNIEILEADVSPIRRLLSDVDSLEVDPEPKCLFLDLETDSRKTFTESRGGQARILSWAVCDWNGENVASSVLEADSDSSEKVHVQKLIDHLKDYDCILAWYGSTFDFDVLQNRAFALGIYDVYWNRWTWLDHLEVYKRNNSLGSGDEKTSYALDHVANYLFGEGKLDFDSGKTWEAWSQGEESRKLLQKYNEQDVKLLPRIEEKSGYLALHFAVCNICRVFPDTQSLNSTAQGDGFMIRLGVEHGIRWKTRTKFEEKIEKFKGAYVMEPERTGAIDNVHVADFSGLYPSIMRTFNMSPDTKVSRYFNGDKCQLPERNTFFRIDKKGMFTIALDQLVLKRAEYSSLMKEQVPGTELHKKFQRLSQAFKVVANSFYGIVGSPYSRFFDPEIAEGVTQTGKWLIHKVIDESKLHGLDPFYGDTDSVFVSGDGEKFREVVKLLNGKWGDLLRLWGIDNHYIDLDFEKTFRRVIMITAKRYVGSFLMYKGQEVPSDAPPEVKGLEFNRGDSIKLARTFQKEIIDKLLEVELPSASSIREIIDRWKYRVYAGEFELEDVVMSQSLSKHLREYKDPIPTHVRVAHILKERGERVIEGSRISYFVVPGTEKRLNPVPSSDIDSIDQLDRAYYWEKRVYPPTQRVVEKVYPTVLWEESRHERRQRRQELEGQMNLFDTFGKSKQSTKGPRTRKKQSKPSGDIIIKLGARDESGGGSVAIIRALKAIAVACPGNYQLKLSIMQVLSDGTEVEVLIDANKKVSRKSIPLFERAIDIGDSIDFS